MKMSMRMNSRIMMKVRIFFDETDGKSESVDEKNSSDETNLMKVKVMKKMS